MLCAIAFLTISFALESSGFSLYSKEGCALALKDFFAPACDIRGHKQNDLGIVGICDPGEIGI
jgi:hypothetical protein